MAPHSPTRAAFWFKDAIIYQLHVKTFCDGNGDGVGDFVGLISKLDYIERLGVNTLWLLPFYPSPLLDDGYDVTDYETVHPLYGSLDDARRFLDEAHRRGLRVITELVINHTSDQHRWFQAARHAPQNSRTRNFYVWSESDKKLSGARIIFRDSESSNWSWDAVAHAYYWHRFFHHQPDLNFDSPDVREAVQHVMRFWLNLGVDGLRLDAIAHLFEREGTSCDNLPETHQFLKQLRATMDVEYPDRVLLAEVNQTPEVTRAYFGAGDECHMAFNFPLMPRLFQALATEQAEPIERIVRLTCDIPENCQWAVFLRNHDELTLSALPPADRVPLLDAYAPVHRMRLNNGIRRRLAPLLGNDRARIMLATTLAMSLPGSPIIYYGDEIGMGDNISLPDRDGVRTPMQWTSDSCGGFMTAASPSGAHPVLPVLDDAVYGYQRVNVSTQQSDPDSQLNAVRHRIKVRRAHPILGRGATRFCAPSSAHVLAFVRELQDDVLLVIANLSRSPVTATLTLPSAVRHLSTTDLLSGITLSLEGGVVTVTLSASAIGWWVGAVVRPFVGPGTQQNG